mmetsp:Transcript_13158/g.33917  ORF Transcript_13158/g.33917 Transcript_13158/m.33917 type:complete len:226 (+) Transcript_13158:1951-2628(+)
MLTLTRDVGVGQDGPELQLLPQRIVGHPVVDVIADGLGHLVQKVGAGRDDIGVEEVGRAAVRQCPALSLPVLPQLHLLPLHLLALLRSAEAPGALLVHLGARGHAVDGHVDDLLRADDADKAVEVQENVLVHVLLVLRRRPVLGVAARVDDAVHIEVQVVKVSIGCIFVEIDWHHTSIHLHGLPLDRVADDLRIPHATPSEEGGDTHGVWRASRSVAPHPNLSLP